jgi:hypothetical protein
VLVAHAAWQRLFAGDVAIVGREVRLNGLPRTVIGVLPRGFVGPTGPADFYLAFELAPAQCRGGLAAPGRPPAAGNEARRGRARRRGGLGLP